MPPRLHRHERATTPPRMRLTERDTAIIQAVAMYRILRQDQIQTLFFGSRSTAQYRLSHLFQHGFLARHFLPVEQGLGTLLYTVDTLGQELLRSAFSLDSLPFQPKQSDHGFEFLAHTLAINDVRIAVTLGCHRYGMTLLDWKGEADLKAAYDRVEIRTTKGVQSVSLIPDSYFLIETPHGRAHFFLELDRGTMTTRRFATKVLAYQTYVASGQYQRRYQAKSLRILTVVPSVPRLAHLKQATEQHGGQRLFWFSTLPEIETATVLTEAIWRIAGNSASQTLIPR